MKKHLVKYLFISATLTFILFLSGCMKPEKSNTIAVYDRSAIFLGRMENPEPYKYRYINDTEYEEIKNNLGETDYFALLSIPPNIVNSNTVQIISDEKIKRELKLQIANNLEDIIEEDKLSDIRRGNDLPLTPKDKRIAQTSIKVIEIEMNKPAGINVREIGAYLVIIALLLFIHLRIRKRRRQSKSV